MGSLSDNDGDRHNVTYLKKWIRAAWLRLFHLIAFNSRNVSKFSGADINRFEVEDKKKKVLFLRWSRLPKSVKLGTLTSS